MTCPRHLLVRIAERWPPGWFPSPCARQLYSADEIMCLCNAARMIVKGSLVSAVSLSPVAYSTFLWYPCILLAMAYGSSSDNNPTYAGYTVNCQKKCSHRSLLKRQKMLNLPNFDERTALTRFTTRVIILWEVLRKFFLQLSLANYLFSKYRLRALISKIPASHRPLLK